MKQVSVRLDEGHVAAVSKYREVVRAQMGYEPTQAQAVKALMSIGAAKFMQPFMQAPVAAPPQAEPEETSEDKDVVAS